MCIYRCPWYGCFGAQKVVKKFRFLCFVVSLKILVTSDFHARRDLLDAAVEEANMGDYDLFINLGDYMDQDYAEELFERVEITSLGCTGNRDMGFSDDFLNSEVSVFNFLEADVDDEYKVILVGGTMMDDFQEEIESIIEEFGDSSKVFVGTHHPPRKVGDKLNTGGRAGWDEYRETILKHQPAVWANGHIHEDYGHRELMGTTVLNAASEESEKGFSVALGDSGGVENVEEVDLL